MTDSDKMREAFEKEYSKELEFVSRDNDLCIYIAKDAQFERIAILVREAWACWQRAWQAAQAEQSVPVVGEVVAWRWRYAQKSEEALATVCFGKPQWESDKVFDGIPSDEAIQRALLKGVVPEYLYRKPTHSITAAELEQMRKDSERKEELERTMRHLRKTLEKIDKYRFCMSYNDSYFGEPEGTVKRVCSELQHCIDAAMAASEGEK